MAIYEYHYLEPSGKKKKGHIEAQGATEAKEKLRSQNIVLIYLTQVSTLSKKQTLRGDVLLAFTVQLSQLVNAGIPLYESLKALEEQSRGEKFHGTILGLCENIHAGASLSLAMAQYPNSFSKLYRGMVSAGEAVGGLGLVLEKLATLLAKQMKLKKQIVTALIYPAVLGGFSLLIIALLLGFVVPSLEGIFADRQLNGFTKMIITLSSVFRFYWMFYIPLLIVGVGWTIWKLKSPQGKMWMQRISLKLPLVRTLVIQSAIARFSRTMGTLLEGGVNMIDSLQISREVMNHQVLEKEIARAEVKIIEGKRLSQELAKSRHIPSMVSKMLAVGEDSGTSVQMFLRIAEMYEQELEKTLDRVMAMAQPLILIVMGIIIGTVLLAILLPLTDMSSFSTA